MLDGLGSPVPPPRPSPTQATLASWDTVAPTLAPTLTVTTIRTVAPLAMLPSVHLTVPLAGFAQLPLLATAPSSFAELETRSVSTTLCAASGPAFTTVTW